MRARVLGSGAGLGLPAWHDGSERALGARSGEGASARREAAALAVSADGARYTLVEAPFHLPSTLTRYPELAPRPGGRSAPLDSLVLTCAELEACTGALALRGALSTRIVSPHGLRDALLDHDAAFEPLEPLWSGLPWDRPLPLDREGQLEARLFPLPGPDPDHLRGRAPGAGRSRCGLRITDTRSGRRLVWAPRMATLDSGILAELREADLRFVDGTFFASAEASAEAGRAGGRAGGSELARHVPISGREGSLVWLSGMRGRSCYVHLGAANPACDEKGEAAEAIRRSGVDIAFDGMEVEV